MPSNPTESLKNNVCASICMVTLVFYMALYNNLASYTMAEHVHVLRDGKKYGTRAVPSIIGRKGGKERKEKRRPQSIKKKCRWMIEYQCLAAVLCLFNYFAKHSKRNKGLKVSGENVGDEYCSWAFQNTLLILIQHLYKVM